MKNIFENAYFGKPYKTRGEKKAIFIAQTLGNAKLITQHKFGFEEFRCSESGSHINLMEEPQSILDIVSEWQEEISEEELDELATKNTIADLGYEFDSHDYTDHSGRNAHWVSYREGWKNAYRKAIEKYGSK